MDVDDQQRLEARVFVLETKSDVLTPTFSTRVEHFDLKAQLTQQFHIGMMTLVFSLLAVTLTLYSLIDDRTARLEARMDAMQASMNQRFERIDQRFERLDQRFERMDQRFERIDQRFDRADQRLDRVQGQIATIETDLKDIKQLLQKKQAPNPRIASTAGP